jgi:hypothetical protein
MKVERDWGYIYFVVPSILSFLFSVTVIFKGLSNRENLRKRFHQLTILMAVFTAIQSCSWFQARYETETDLCYMQEYLFQISTLYQGFIAIIICSTIFYTIRYGKTPPINSHQTLMWIIIPLFFVAFSCGFKTASIFCPFNRQHELYFPNLQTSGPRRPCLGYFLFYLLPMSSSWGFTLYYSIKSWYHANRLATDSISMVASQLRLYPLTLAICMFPISAFFLIVIFAGKEIHPILFVGAILASSTGTVNGIAYLLITRASTAKRSTSIYQRSPLTTALMHAALGESSDVNNEHVDIIKKANCHPNRPLSGSGRACSEDTGSDSNSGEGDAPLGHSTGGLSMLWDAEDEEEEKEGVDGRGMSEQDRLLQSQSDSLWVLSPRLFPSECGSSAQSYDIVRTVRNQHRAKTRTRERLEKPEDNDIERQE